MYLGIDVGGTKTLAASFDEQGGLAEKVQFPTASEYPKFLEDLKRSVDGLAAKDFKRCAAGIPATVIDRSRGIGVSFGNLPWKDAPVQDDIQRLFGCPVAIENDAKLAGLSESVALKNEYRRVMYVTLSTGIGLSLVVDGVIDTNFGDAGGRALLLEHEGEITPWEDFAGGRAIFEHYGKKASDLDDGSAWQEISRDLAKGLILLIAMVQPEIIVVGGSVGTHFKKYGSMLAGELAKYPLPLVPQPRLAGAARPEEAVIYGCYELIRQAGSHSTDG